MLHQSSCPDSCVSTKNSNDLTFAWTSKKMLLMTPAFFWMSLRVMKPGFTPTTQKPKLNPVNGKVQGHLDRRRQRKWEATSSQCWFVSLIRRELFTKNLFLLVKQLMLHCTSNFGDVYGRMCKGSNLISGRTIHGCSTMTMRQPMLPSWLYGFWLITTWLWCHILPTRLTLHPATFSYFQNWKWSLRFQIVEEIQAESQAVTPLGSLSSLRRGLLWRWCRPLMSKVSLSVSSVRELIDYTSHFTGCHS